MRHSSSSTAEPHQAAAGAVQQVAPLHYHRLRMLAECAAGLEQDTDFAFTPEGDLHVGAKPRAGTVLVPARGRGRYPRNVVRLHTARTEDGGVEEMRIEPGIADALFWSDSAVHKFVVPYVASCACHDAPQALATLLAAWNYYPADRVTVYALVHVLKDGGGITLSMENRIHVVYAERRNGSAETTLARLPLGDFVKAYPPAGGPGAGEPAAAAANGSTGSAGHQVAYRHGGESDRSQRPDYTTLRALAEHACALSTGPQYFLFKAGEHGFRQKTTTEMPEMEPGDLVLPAYTPTVPPHRPRLHGVWCEGEDGGASNVAARADAMFWSDGAIEQFMLPYYASKGGLQLGLRELAEMTDTWSGSATWRRNGEQDLREGSAEGDAPNSIVHLTTSEWYETNPNNDTWWWIPDAQGGNPGTENPAEPGSAPGPDAPADPYPPTNDGTYHTVSYLSPRRETGFLYSRGGTAAVMRTGELMARRGGRA